jgi:hypothetical protein
LPPYQIDEGISLNRTRVTLGDKVTPKQPSLIENHNQEEITEKRKEIRDKG